MHITPIFSIGVGRVSASEYLPLARKIFSENQHLLADSGRMQTNILLQNPNKDIIREDYTNPEEVDIIKNMILDRGLDYLKSPLINYYNEVYEYKVVNFWMNQMQGKNFLTEHAHPGYVISGTYYIDAPAGANPIVFHAPYINYLPDSYLIPESYTPFNTLMYQITPKEGEILFWFSPLRHSVPAGQNPEGVRRAMVFDITVTNIKEEYKKQYYQ